VKKYVLVCAFRGDETKTLVGDAFYNSIHRMWELSE
jgi:hypothetical protein